MDVVMQLLMGVSLAACAGLRAMLPLLAVGLLGRTGYLPINHAFDFLTRTDMLVVLGIAAVLEMAGDKILAVDHALDAIGTVARPAAGAILASAVFRGSGSGGDPGLVMLLGLAAGGGAALTVHAGKAAARVQASALAPLHAGSGNLILSIIEDLWAIGGIWAAVVVPALAFGLTVLLLILAARLTVRLAARVVRRRRSARG